jgi:L-lactate dehydrogenase (cytochrome)
MKMREIRELMRSPPHERDRVQRKLSRCLDMDDLRDAARRMLPRAVFDYVDGGADEEISITANSDAFRSYNFVPRAMRCVGQVSLATQFLNADIGAPIGLAPTGYTRLVSPAGEPAVARAAAACGVPYVLSTVGTTTIEELAEVGHPGLWFQLYVLRDRGLTWSLLERAAAAGVAVLEVSVDTAVSGRRLRDVRNGFTIPPALTFRTMADIAVHPRYWTGVITSPPLRFASLVTRRADGPPTIADITSLFDPDVSWDCLADIRERWPRRLLVKGPLGPADAERAIQAGADGVHLSNHGGRQLDRTIPPVELIRPVRERVGDRCAIAVDSGIRHGADVLVALARGADLCMVGRAYLYGLAAGGEAGVHRSIELLVDQLRRTMQLCGVSTLPDLRKYADEIVVPAMGTSGARRTDRRRTGGAG